MTGNATASDVLSDVLVDELFRSVDTGLCLLGEGGVIVRANEIWLRAMGLRAEEALRRPYAALNPEGASLVLPLLSRERGASVILPPSYRRDGSDWHERAVAVPAISGPGVLLIAKERGPAAAQEELRALRSAIDALPIGLLAVEVGPDGPEAVALNLAHRRLVGMPERVESTNPTPRHQLFRSDRLTPLPLLDWPGPRAAISGKPVSETILHALLPNGEWRVLEASASPVATDQDGRLRSVVVTIDVSERYQATEALRVREATYRAAFENVRDVVSLLQAERDSAGRITDWVFFDANERVADMLGQTRSEVLGKRLSEMTTHERFPLLHEKLSKVLQSGESIRYEAPVLESTFLVTMFRIDAEKVGTAAVDITERKANADRLLAAKERLAVTLKSIGDGVITTDERGHVTLLNGVAEEMTGWRASDALGRPLLEVFNAVSEETGHPIADPAQRVLREGIMVTLASHTMLLSRAGRWRPIADSAAPIRDANGAISGVVLVFRDQTEERAAEEALLRSRAELNSLVENLPIGVFVTDDGAIVYANPAFVALLGYQDQSQLTGRNPSELTAQGAPPGPAPGREWTVLAAQGRTLDLECSSVRAIHFGGRPASLWTCRDLSELKAVQARLMHADRLASVGMLAAGVAHEVNNPLTYVLGALELIDERLASIFASRSLEGMNEIAASVHDARHGALRVKAIVSDLRRFSRPEGDERISLNLPRLVESAIGMATHEIDHRARLVKDFHPVPPVVANEARLGQVFLNLLVNAAHAIVSGTPEENEILVTLATDEQGRAVVEIRDTGVGIPAHLMDRIFEPFFTTKAGTGTGLGLAISRNTVMALGGAITIESTVGVGTKTRVVLPPGEDTPAPTLKAPAPAVSRRRAKVLVVDDEITICKLLQRALQSEHEVSTSVHAVDALERIRAGQRFDVVLCDLMMPQMTGIELYQSIEQSHPEQAARFVFTTGGTFTQSAEDFLQRVPHARLTKPFALQEVRTLVRSMALTP